MCVCDGSLFCVHLKTIVFIYHVYHFFAVCYKILTVYSVQCVQCQLFLAIVMKDNMKYVETHNLIVKSCVANLLQSTCRPMLA